jgi:hypothetical protein
MLVARRDVVASDFCLFRPTPFMLAEITAERGTAKKKCEEYQLARAWWYRKNALGLIKQLETSLFVQIHPTKTPQKQR